MTRQAPRPRPDAATRGDEADPAGAAPDGAGPSDEEAAPAASRGRGRKPSGGVSVIVGGLLQDLEARLRRELPPIEERARFGEELRVAAAARGPGAGPGMPPADPLVVVLPPGTPRKGSEQR